MIATAQSARAKTWKNAKTTWSKLVEKLTTAYHTHETMDEYKAMSKDDQSRIKDVGGFVGGYLKDGRRLNGNVEFRQILCLDLDDATDESVGNLLKQYPVAVAVYSTHKHTPAKPRLRLVLPLSRPCKPDEYEAVGRRVGEAVGIQACDPSTFQPARLMYWPSTPKDGEFVGVYYDGPWLDVEEILDSYFDWTDTSEWPRSLAEGKKVSRDKAKQENPTEKKGLVGAFCRVYSVTRALDELLDDAYESTGFGDRYTFKGGSTSAGLVIYDDLFAYSNHSTDPAAGILCNAFDLVRLHKFGHLDADTEVSGQKAPSFKAMLDYVLTLPEVKKEAVESQLGEALADFDGDDTEAPDSVDDDWMLRLEMEGKSIKNSAPNYTLILKNDPKLKKAFKYNSFMCRECVVKDLPWRKASAGLTLTDNDMAGLRNYIESVYGISSPNRLEDALSLEMHGNSFHPVREYLARLKWDGQSRIDTLLIRYLGAKDSDYSREVIRKTLVGAVARVLVPGIKFDQMTVLVGPQGCGKSTFINKLAGEWFSDTLSTVQGKEAYEAIQGVWIMEMGELSAVKKAEVESTKLFISKTEDRFRPAYGRKVESFRRQNIFVGTTNNSRFLKDATGNRRFFPVDVTWGKCNLFGANSELDAERDQIWAEALHLWENGEPLILSQKAEAQAGEERDAHQEADDRAGVIEQYLDMMLPSSWDSMSLIERRRYLQEGESGLKEKGVVTRTQVSIAEIWCECLGKDADTLTKYNSRDVTEAMASVPSWVINPGTRLVPLYGRQRTYRRTESL